MAHPNNQLPVCFPLTVWIKEEINFEYNLAPNKNLC